MFKLMDKKFINIFKLKISADLDLYISKESVVAPRLQNFFHAQLIIKNFFYYTVDY